MEGYYVGIDVGGTNTKIMVMSSDLEVLDMCTFKTSRELGYEKISDNIIKAIEAIFQKNKIQDPNILSIGMGLPGIVDSKARKALYLSYLLWEGFDPSEKIGKYFNAPSYMDNDASISAFGEYRFGIKMKYQNIILITLGTGVGCGIIIDGKIFSGSRNVAHELGHLTIGDENAEPCYHCGRPGCLEAYCAGPALELYAKKRMNEFPNSILHTYVKDNGGVYDNSFITAGVEAGDELSEIVMTRYIKYLSIGVANVMKMFNPELILIGGGISNAGDFLIKPLAEHAKKLVLREEQYCPIQKAVLGSKAGMYGACALAEISRKKQIV